MFDEHGLDMPGLSDWHEYEVINLRMAKKMDQLAGGTRS